MTCACSPFLLPRVKVYSQCDCYDGDWHHKFHKVYSLRENRVCDKNYAKTVAVCHNNMQQLACPWCFVATKLCGKDSWSILGNMLQQNVVVCNKYLLYDTLCNVLPAMLLHCCWLVVVATKLPSVFPPVHYSGTSFNGSPNSGHLHVSDSLPLYRWTCNQTIQIDPTQPSTDSLNETNMGYHMKISLRNSFTKKLSTKWFVPETKQN